MAAERIDDENAVLWNSKGKVLYQLSSYEEALAAHDKAIQIDPNLAEAYRDKADIWENLARRARAKADEIENQAVDTTISYQQLEGESSLIRLGKMISSGKIQVGEKVYVDKRPDQLAKIVDRSKVEFQGKRLSINEWAKKMTGWRSVNIYTNVYLERTRQPLGQLREEI